MVHPPLPFRVEQVFLFDIVALRASLVAAGVGGQ